MGLQWFRVQYVTSSEYQVLAKNQFQTKFLQLSIGWKVKKQNFNQIK